MSTQSMVNLKKRKRKRGVGGRGGNVFIAVKIEKYSISYITQYSNEGR